MMRNIIKIDEELCIGCGLCVNACQESAIQLVNGKAKLMRDDYCDGLGNCLPVCPTNAISFEQREALAFNKEEVLKNKETMNLGCPGSQSKSITSIGHNEPDDIQSKRPSMLNQWPVQIQLVQANAPFFDDSKLLIAADCTAYAYSDFHAFMKDKITLIGCPKLDDTDYSDKLTDILTVNDIKSLTLIRMEVPCCAGILHAAKTALSRSGKMIPWRVITISTDGKVIEDL